MLRETQISAQVNKVVVSVTLASLGKSPCVALGNLMGANDIDSYRVILVGAPLFHVNARRHH